MEITVRPLANRDPKVNIGYFRTTDSVYRQLFFFITLNLTWKITYLSHFKGYSHCQFNLENKKPFCQKNRKELKQMTVR